MGDVQAHRQGVPGRRPDRLGGRAHLLRGAVAVSHGDRPDRDPRARRPVPADLGRSAADHRPGRPGVGRRHVPRADPGRRQGQGRRRRAARLRPRRRRLVGLRVRRRVLPRRERHLRDARGAAVLEAPPPAGAGHGRDDVAARARRDRDRRHGHPRPGRRRRDRARLGRPSPSGTGQSGRCCWSSWRA